jgi:hypothetical protein
MTVFAVATTSKMFGSWAERDVLVICNKVTNATPLLWL